MSEPSWLVSTRSAYDTVAVDYERLLRDALAAAPLDRALLAAFAELVPPGGPVLDLGCGPGRLTGHLQALGLAVSGLDLSPGMVAVARARHPSLDFVVGSMTDLDLPDGALGGVLAWYSIIHLPPGQLPTVFAGLLRVLAPGGQLLLAFQAGDERIQRDQAYGHPVALVSYRRPADRVRALLVETGFAVDAELVREPQTPETNQQAYLLAHRP